MRHWSQIATRNWRAKPGRTAGATAAVALGVGVVVWVTGSYESVRQSLEQQVWTWIGESHVTVESLWGHRGTVYQKVTDDLDEMDIIASYTCRYTPQLSVSDQPIASGDPKTAPAKRVRCNVIGIQPETEYAFRDYGKSLTGGRLLTPEDDRVCMIEDTLAAELGLDLDDTVFVQLLRDNDNVMYGYDKAAAGPHPFTIVGLIRNQRVAKFQPPVMVVPLEVLRPIAPIAADDEPRVTSIDIRLADPSVLENAADAHKVVRSIQRIAKQKGGLGADVSSAGPKRRQIAEAQRQSQFVLMLVASVALFTAFFIILSTMSMGMIERITQLGLLRCLGATRAQTGMIVLAEVVPIAIVGILLGLPVGFGLIRVTMALAPAYLGAFAISWPGLVLAVVGGGLTTLAGGALPAVWALRVSPLDATRSQAKPVRWISEIVAAVLGGTMIVMHMRMVDDFDLSQWLKPQTPILAVMFVYCGYALLTPLLIRLVSLLAVRVIAVVLWLRPKLLYDQVGRETWRSAGICSGLMVGLSLIVTLVVYAESLIAGWDFPRQMADAFVWDRSSAVPRKRVEAVQSIEGIAKLSPANTMIGTVSRAGGPFNFPVWTQYVAGDPDTFFEMARVTFVAGDRDEAFAKLDAGGHVLITSDFARSREVGPGDRLTFRLGSVSLFGGGGKSAVFTVAGVVEAPALSIAANFFQANGPLTFAASTTIFGTLPDAKRLLGSDDVQLLLLDFDLDDTPPPAEFLARDPRTLAATFQVGGLTLSNPAELTDAQRWRWFREQSILRDLADGTGMRDPIWGSVRQMKETVDREIRGATLLFTMIPTVALIVAALGVGNLMMANVASRSRQIAILRAVGATQWQIARLVFGEALVLGTLGSAIGVALGLHMADNINSMTLRIHAFQPEWVIPWAKVLAGIALTGGICLVAGLLPAKHAARSNIASALQTT